MADIRNECREWMTNDTSYIGTTRQVLWFFNDYLPAFKRGDMLASLLYDDANVPVAFGIRAFRESRWVVTGGVATVYRGRGHGHRMFTDLSVGFPETWLDVLTDNTRAIALYESLGFKFISSDDRINTMCRIE